MSQSEKLPTDRYVLMSQNEKSWLYPAPTHVCMVSAMRDERVETSLPDAAEALLEPDQSSARSTSSPRALSNGAISRPWVKLGHFHPLPVLGAVITHPRFSCRQPLE